MLFGCLCLVEIDNTPVAMLQEDGINLMTVIKRTLKFRRSRKHDSVSDFLPPSMTEFNHTFDEEVG